MAEGDVMDTRLAKFDADMAAFKAAIGWTEQRGREAQGKILAGKMQEMWRAAAVIAANEMIGGRTDYRWTTTLGGEGSRIRIKLPDDWLSRQV